jgi:hypothetical protein
MSDAKAIQKSIDYATKNALIDGAMCAQGWVYLYLGTQTVKLRDDVAATFLQRLSDPHGFVSEGARIYRLDSTAM